MLHAVISAKSETNLPKSKIQKMSPQGITVLAAPQFEAMEWGGKGSDRDGQVSPRA